MQIHVPSKDGLKFEPAEDKKALLGHLDGFVKDLNIVLEHDGRMITFNEEEARLLASYIAEYLDERSYDE